MKYLGSKNRYAKYLLPIILKDRKETQWYVEPFCGGCNLIDKVPGKRIANDKNRYLIALLTAVIYQNFRMDYIDKQLYEDIRDNKENYCDEEVGWAGFIASYCGKFFAGFAGIQNCANGTKRNYQKEAANNLLKQAPNLKEIFFTNYDYTWLQIPKNSIVYLDPPYQDTTKYKDEIDYTIFWNWVRDIAKENTIFISSYTAPEDFQCIWEMETKNTLDKRVAKTNTEKLFIPK